MSKELIEALANDEHFACVDDYQAALRVMVAECAARGISTVGMGVIWYDSECEVFGPQQSGEHDGNGFVFMDINRDDYATTDDASAFAKAIRLAQIITATPTPVITATPTPAERAQRARDAEQAFRQRVDFARPAEPMPTQFRTACCGAHDGTANDVHVCRSCYAENPAMVEAVVITTTTAPVEPDGLTPLCMHCVRENIAAGYIATDDGTWRPKDAGEECGEAECGWWSFPDANTMARRVALRIANMAAEEADVPWINEEWPERAELIEWITWQDRNADVDGLTLAGLVAVVVGIIRDNIEDMTPDDPSRLSVSSDVTQMTIGALDVG